MKKRNWLLLLLIVLCLAAFFGYRKLDQLRTDTRAPQIHIDEQPLEVSVRDDKARCWQASPPRTMWTGT